MIRLASEPRKMRSRYDVVVVGSGYGGAIAASRLARCGRKVGLLERGREILPGEFPDSLEAARKELQITGAKLRLGSRQALYDLRVGDDVDVFLGCGLGGTSLINANVCLWPDERVFADPVWPEPIRRDGLLREGLARSRRWLRPELYKGRDKLAKVEALRQAARWMDREAKPVPLHISFAPEPNAANVVQPACTLCGDCMTGCNVGAKTTTLTTYLPDAVHHGAEIFTGTAVRTLAREPGGGWRVVFRWHRQDGVSVSESEHAVSADIVVLAAGTLGSTEILLRSAAGGLALSDRLGYRFTSNGDAFANGYNNAVAVNGVGVGHPPRAAVGPVGPAVASLLDERDSARMEDGQALCECALPSLTAALLPGLLAPGATLFGETKFHSLGEAIEAAGRSVHSLVNGAYSGAIHNTQTFMAVGHDNSGGRIELEGDRAKIGWPGAAKQPVYERSEALFKRTVAATGGTFVRNPLSTKLMGEKLTTVHPLGGCVMGADRGSGVVNHKCQVFDATPGAAADAVHDGLFVCDGSVIPRSVGIHPLLTISAVAERALMLLARDRGWRFDADDAHNAPRLDVAPVKAATPMLPGFFSRLMHGR